jgi:hypothetical protein
MPTVTTPLPDLVLYGRPGCHLCEEAHELLVVLLAERASAGLPAPTPVERSIDGDQELQRRFALTIPVVAVGDRELELATSAAKLRRFLTETLDGAPVA